MTNDKQRVDFPVGENVREDKRGTPRGRLVELLNYITCKAEGCSATDGGRCGDLDKLYRCQIEAIADNLLANGVIVPPCKVGDTVYVLEDWGYEKELEEKEVGVIAIAGTDDFSKELWEDFHGCAIGTFADVSKTVFLTREEAEQALVTDKNVGGKKEEGVQE